MSKTNKINSALLHPEGTSHLCPLPFSLTRNPLPFSPNLTPLLFSLTLKPLSYSINLTPLPFSINLTSLPFSCLNLTPLPFSLLCLNLSFHITPSSSIMDDTEESKHQHRGQRAGLLLVDGKSTQQRRAEGVHLALFFVKKIQIITCTCSPITEDFWILIRSLKMKVDSAAAEDLSTWRVSHKSLIRALPEWLTQRDTAQSHNSIFHRWVQFGNWPTGPHNDQN